MASRIFANASSSVAPCDQHPGSPGQETLYPSSVRIRATGYFIFFNLASTSGFVNRFGRVYELRASRYHSRRLFRHLEALVPTIVGDTGGRLDPHRELSARVRVLPHAALTSTLSPKVLGGCLPASGQW